jgi:hypothetical protein
MISLKRIVEVTNLQGQVFDLASDFANFQRAVDGSAEQVKKEYEAKYNQDFAGKRIRARAALQYKQDEQDREFDVSKITIEPKYGNFVVVAHDTSNPKKTRRYYINPIFKIQIVGLASGHPSPTTAPGEPQKPTPMVVASPEQPKQESKSSMPMKEDDGIYEAYSLESIEEDIKPWLSSLVKDPRLGVQEFVKSLGWKKTGKDGNMIALYDVKIPKEALKIQLTKEYIDNIVNKTDPSKGRLIPVKFADDNEFYNIRIKKTMKNNPTDIPSDTGKPESI